MKTLKRKIALYLSVLMMITMLMPLQILADEDKGLENAIRIAKEKFSIPENLSDFNYNIRTEDTRKIWNLSWGTKDYNDGRVSVEIDDKGLIIHYNYYKPYDAGRNYGKLPKLSRQEAKVKAQEFIKKVNPDLLDQIKLNESGIEELMGEVYSFNFMRLVNSIPFYSNNINVGINRQTGEVQNYYCRWSDNLVFPSADKAVSLKDAEKLYKEKIGLKLVYGQTNENDKVKTYPIYIPKYNNANIDALMGEKVDLYPGYYGPYYDGYYGGAGMSYDRAMVMKAAGEYTKESVSLSPVESKAVEEVSKLMTKDDAEKIARGLKVLELTEEFKLNAANLSRYWSSNTDFVWDMNFMKEPKGKTGDYRHISVCIDAKTGEIKRFYTYYPRKDGDKAKYNESESKTAVENFLKEMQPEKFKQSEYDDSNKNFYFEMPVPGGTEKDLPLQQRFTYVRKVNGIQFAGNNVSAEYDAVNGKISSYEMNWFDAEFALLDKVLPIDKAYEKLFGEIGLELQYKTKYPDEYYLKYSSDPAGLKVKPEVSLVYALKPNKPSVIDAFTGIILDGSGKPFKEIKPIEYKDIAGHFAENQIKVLAEYGIALEGSEFKPNTGITQKEFMVLLAKLLNYYGPYGRSISTDSEIEALYKYLIREGILKETEKLPDSSITREESVKFLIRAMKYDKIADIKGIFKCDFEDANDINQDLIGYIAIAQGLKIVCGDGKFMPKDELTRAQAIVMIYNYLQR